MAKVLSNLKKAEKKADVVEIWLDQVKDIDLKKLFKEAKKPILAKGRPELVEAAAWLGAAFVDLDIGVRKIPEVGKAKIIISYHNFEKTPFVEELLKVADLAIKKGGEIVKIATMIKKYQDNVTLLELVKRLCEKKVEVICVGMGERGKLSRVMLPILGSSMVFAALDAKSATAPGQMTVHEFKDLIKQLH